MTFLNVRDHGNLIKMVTNQGQYPYFVHLELQMVSKRGKESLGLWLLRDGSMVMHQKLYMTDFERFRERRCLWIVREGNMGHHEGQIRSEIDLRNIRNCACLIKRSV